MPDHEWMPLGYGYDSSSGWYFFTSGRTEITILVMHYDGYAFSINFQPTITVVSTIMNKLMVNWRNTRGIMKCPKKHVKEDFFMWWHFLNFLKCPKIEDCKLTRSGNLLTVGGVRSSDQTTEIMKINENKNFSWSVIEGFQIWSRLVHLFSFLGERCM